MWTFESTVWQTSEEAWSNCSLLLHVAPPLLYIISGHAHKQLSCTKPLPRGNIGLSNKHEMRNLSKKACLSLVPKPLPDFILQEMVDSVSTSLVPRLSCREEEREPGTHCWRMCQVPLVICILLRYTKIKEGRDCISHLLQCLAGMQERMDNASSEELRTFVAHSSSSTQRGQWQASFIQKKSAYLAEVSVTEQILRKFPNPQKSWENWVCANSVYQALFSTPTH